MNRKLAVTAAVAAILGAIAAHLLWPRAPHYALQSGPEGSTYRLDTLTGEVVWIYGAKHLVSQPAGPAFDVATAKREK